MVQPLVMDSPVVRGRRVTVRFDPGGAAAYLREREVWAEYPDLDDLASLDEGLLVIPALGTLATVCFALGVPMHVKAVDAEYAAGIDQVNVVFGEMYPSFRAAGFALSGERVATARRPGQGAVMLFSGGVDSTSSLIEHRDEVRDLVSVWGADVPVQDAALWRELEQHMRDSELVQGRRLTVVQSNIKEVVDGTRLTRRFSDDMHGYHWWGAAQHGLALTSLALPVAAHDGRETIYIASTGSPLESPEPWGSSPKVDNCVRWTNGRVQHDQPHHTRHLKMHKVIGPYVREGGGLTLAVCYQIGRGGSEGLNCGRCEKCMRTVTALLAEGIDPTLVGVPWTAAALANARRQLDGKVWSGTLEHQVMWTEIQSAIPAELTGIQTVPEVREYLEWMRGTTLDLINHAAPSRGERLKAEGVYYASTVARHLPMGVRKALHRSVGRWLLPPL